MVKNRQLLIQEVGSLEGARKRQLHSLTQEVVDGLFEEALHRLDSLLDLVHGLIAVEKGLDVAHCDVEVLHFASHVEALDGHEESRVDVEVNDGCVDLRIQGILDVRGNLAHHFDAVRHHREVRSHS